MGKRKGEQHFLKILYSSLTMTFPHIYFQYIYSFRLTMSWSYLPEFRTLHFLLYVFCTPSQFYPIFPISQISFQPFLFRCYEIYFNFITKTYLHFCFFFMSTFVFASLKSMFDGSLIHFFVLHSLDPIASFATY